MVPARLVAQGAQNVATGNDASEFVFLVEDERGLAAGDDGVTGGDAIGKFDDGHFGRDGGGFLIHHVADAG